MRALMFLLFLVTSGAWTQALNYDQCVHWDQYIPGDPTESHEFPLQTRQPFQVVKSFTWTGPTDSVWFTTCDNCSEHRDVLIDAQGHRQSASFQNGPSANAYHIFPSARFELVHGMQYRLESWLNPSYAVTKCFAVQTTEQRDEKEGRFILATVVYFGMLASMLIVNLALLYAIRNNHFWDYILFTGFYGAGVVLITGLPQWVFPSTAWMIPYADLPFSLALFFAFRFSIYYLHLGEYLPRTTHFFSWAVYGIPLWILLQFLEWIPQVLYFSYTYCVLGIVLIWIFTLFYGFKKPQGTTFLLSLALGVFVCGMWIFIGYSEFGLYSFVRGYEFIPPFVGHIIENLIFTFYLARQAGVLYQANKSQFRQNTQDNEALTRNFSHELRTPLVGLYGVSEEKYPRIALKILKIKEQVAQLFQSAREKS